MKHLIGFGLIAYFLITALPAMAQTATPTPYVYVANTSAQFESEISNMTYDANWSSETWERVSTTSGVMSFWVRGKYLMIWRRTTNYLSGTNIQICVASSCSTYSNYNFYYNYTTEPAIYTLPDGSTNYQVQITCQNFCGLDYFMVLSEASALVYPSPTPINTPLPTPTAMSSSTPAPTATPQPSSTPLGLVWSIDPSCDYSTTPEGQITCERYEVDPAGVFNGVMLFALFVVTLVSLWFNARRIVE
jgi:hypothetical protein